MNTIKVYPNELPVGSRFAWSVSDVDVIRTVVAVKQEHLFYRLEGDGGVPFVSPIDKVPAPVFLVCPSLYAKETVRIVYRRRRLVKAYTNYFVYRCQQAKKRDQHDVAIHFQRKAEQYTILMWQYSDLIDQLLQGCSISKIPDLPSVGVGAWLRCLVAPMRLQMAVIAFL
jgi:hypothetical protein